MEIKDVAQLILFVLPGFLALDLYHRIDHVPRQNDIKVLAWSLIYGVIILSSIYWLDTTYLDDKLGCKAILDQDGEKFPELSLVITLLAGGVILGYIKIGIHKLGLIISDAEDKRPTLNALAKALGLLPDFLCVWQKVNRPSNRDWAKVFLIDGTTYCGYVSKYTFNPDSENHDFLLSEVVRLGHNGCIEETIKGTGVYLNLRHVRRIEFLHGNNKKPVSRSSHSISNGIQRRSKKELASKILLLEKQAHSLKLINHGLLISLIVIFLLIITSLRVGFTKLRVATKREHAVYTNTQYFPINGPNQVYDTYNAQSFIQFPSIKDCDSGLEAIFDNE